MGGQIGHGSGAAEIGDRLGCRCALRRRGRPFRPALASSTRPARHRGAVDRRSLRRRHPVDADVDDGFVAREQNFIQAFAAPRAGEDDVDIERAARSRRGGSSFSARSRMRRRLAHFEHVDRGARRRARAGRRSAVGGRRNDEIDGFAHGHEITHHFRMGHGDGPPRSICALNLARPSRPNRAHCRTARKSTAGRRPARRAPHRRVAHTFQKSVWSRRARTPDRRPYPSRSARRRRRRRPSRRRH